MRTMHNPDRTYSASSFKSSASGAAFASVAMINWGGRVHLEPPRVGAGYSGGVPTLSCRGISYSIGT